MGIDPPLGPGQTHGQHHQRTHRDPADQFFLSRRLVALSGFYEWQAQPPDWQVAMPYYITVVDQDPFFLARLWDRSVAESGEVIESCTVITMPANELMADIHDSKKTAGRRTLLPPEDRRMPAILAQEDHETPRTRHSRRSNNSPRA